MGVGIGGVRGGQFEELPPVEGGQAEAAEKAQKLPRSGWTDPEALGAAVERARARLAAWTAKGTNHLLKWVGIARGELKRLEGAGLTHPGVVRKLGGSGAGVQTADRAGGREHPVIVAKYGVPFPGPGPIVTPKYGVPRPGGGSPDPVVVAKYGVPFPGPGPIVSPKYGVPRPGGGNPDPVVVAKYGVPFPGPRPVVTPKYGVPRPGGGSPDPVVVAKYGVPFPGPGPIVSPKYGVPISGGKPPRPVITPKYGVPVPRPVTTQKSESGA